jgi:DNA repair photolyase
MRGILEALRDFANPFSILTKGTLILRDIDLLTQCAEVTEVGTNVSVGAINAELWRLLEPGTPSPRKRLDACRALNEAGIPCGVLMAPVVPFLSDDDASLEETVRAIAEARATHVYPIALHLRTGAREWFLKWVEEHRPDLLPRYQALYRRGAYAPKAYQQDLAERVHRLARRHGIGRGSSSTARRIHTPAPLPEQLSLG